MTHGRRTSDRRRRVLYSAYHADVSTSTAASRREAQRLREARRPPAAYGSRVHRRLRARWFSLVPVRRRTTIVVLGALCALALLLCGTHYASVAWPWLAYRPEIARPLRIDRPDSFGRWFVVALLTGSAGVSLLIYQLRRYRNDDYKGRYRLWRLVLVVMVLASVNSLVSIIDWGGAVLDAAFGKRVALTGSDWIRLVLSFGGVVLVLQLIAEVRRCRFALGMMLLAGTLLAIPEAAKWNVLQVDSVAIWVTVTSAPLLAFTSLFVSLLSYLRMLYREVRQIDENDSLLQRFQDMRLRLFQRSAEEGSEPDQKENRRLRRRRERWQSRSVKAEPDVDPPAQEEETEEENFEPEQAGDEDLSDAPTPRPRRRWFGLRRAKTQAEPDQQVPDASDAEDEPPNSRRRKKRRRFSMRLAPPAETADERQTATQEETETTCDEETGNESPNRRRGLGGWLRRKQASDTESGNDGPEPGATSQASTPAGSDQQGDEINPDEIDWSSLSKSERRRLRKQLKRQRRAA